MWFVRALIVYSLTAIALNTGVVCWFVYTKSLWWILVLLPLLYADGYLVKRAIKDWKE